MEHVLLQQVAEQHVQQAKRSATDAAAENDLIIDVHAKPSENRLNGRQHKNERRSDYREQNDIAGVLGKWRFLTAMFYSVFCLIEVLEVTSCCSCG